MAWEGVVRRVVPLSIAIAFLVPSALTAAPLAGGLCAAAGYGCALWEDRTQTGTATHVTMSPDSTRVFTAGPEGYPTRITAYDAATGRTLWTRTFTEEPHRTSWVTGIAATATRVILSNYGREAMVATAFDADTGALAWTSRVQAQWRGAPTTATLSPDGATFVIAGGLDYDLGVAAFDVTDGSVRWIAREHVSDAIATSVAADAHNVYALVPLSGEAGELRAYDLGTGTLAWGRRLSAPQGLHYWPTSVVTNGENVYVGAQTRGFAYCPTLYYAHIVHAFNARTGQTTWESSVCGNQGNSEVLRQEPILTLAGDRVLAAGVSPWTFKLKANAFDADTGTVLWETTVATAKGHPKLQSARAAPDGTRLYLAGFSLIPDYWAETEGFLVALDAQTGKSAWTSYVPNPTEFVGAYDVFPSPDGARVALGGLAAAPFPDKPGYRALVAMYASDTRQVTMMAR